MAESVTNELLKPRTETDADVAESKQLGALSTLLLNELQELTENPDVKTQFALSGKLDGATGEDSRVVVFPTGGGFMSLIALTPEGPKELMFMGSKSREAAFKSALDGDAISNEAAIPLSFDKYPKLQKAINESVTGDPGRLLKLQKITHTLEQSMEVNPKAI
ncbi:MAG: hypothetical protein Q8P26_04040 [Candidatus Levybacteria bacterium]|nr:hypothetical protein [Candidatus Levybacteria bacterium]MDZ4228462.1 hypothetical protein [Candidatus Levybacteria bacterium]